MSKNTELCARVINESIMEAEHTISTTISTKTSIIILNGKLKNLDRTVSVSIVEHGGTISICIDCITDNFGYETNVPSWLVEQDETIIARIADHAFLQIKEQGKNPVS